MMVISSLIGLQANLLRLGCPCGGGSKVAGFRSGFSIVVRAAARLVGHHMLVVVSI